MDLSYPFAFLNMQSAFFTLETFHKFKDWSNLFALQNIYDMSVTFDTFQSAKR